MTDTQTRVTGSLTIDSWDQDDDAPADGVTRSRARIAKTFRGGVEGTSRTDLLLAVADAGAMTYCGFEQLTATIGDRAGMLLLRHAAEAGAGVLWMTWTVIPDAGTGDLATATGEGQIERHDDGSHTFWLDLSFG